MWRSWRRAYSRISAWSNAKDGKSGEPAAEPRAIRRLSYKQQRELAELPALIERLESDVAALHEAMSQRDFYQQPGEQIAVETKRAEDLRSQLAIAYKVFRCWVSEYQAMPELDASGNAIAIQTLKLENEGWERDYEVGEPEEPSFTEPEG